MPTPLYDALRQFAQKSPIRMHMPGHKGIDIPMAEYAALFPLDFTELPPTGNLFDSDGPIQEAEALWAEGFGMDQCLFLTGGSTQGLHTGLALTCVPGSRILVDRGCHRSVFHAMGILDLQPVYLGRPWLSGPGVTGPVYPQDVESLLKNDPKIKTVCITSPTYYGVLSDIPAIAEVCHRFGAKLVVDGAHGAHLPFLGYDGFRAADVVVVSAHKTLSAPGQSALLFVNAMTGEQVRRVGAVFGSSSPSYPMMAALDCVREWMLGEGGRAYEQVARRTALLRDKFPCLTPADAPLDPTRLVVCCEDGPGTEKKLQEINVWPEMSDAGHVVCILTGADRAEQFCRLETSLMQLGLTENVVSTAGHMRMPPPAEQVLSVRDALFAPVEYVAPEQALDRIAAQSVAPYPPGIPVIAPGERIHKKLLAYLKEIGYNSDIAVVLP